MPEDISTAAFARWLDHVADVVNGEVATTFTDDEVKAAAVRAREALEVATRNGKVVTGEIPAVEEDGQ